MSDLQMAKQLLSGMRLELTPEKLDELAGLMEMYRAINIDFQNLDVPLLSKREIVKKSAQLQGALNKAKRLYFELQGELCDIENIPPLEIESATLKEIKFTRNAEDEDVLGARKAADQECLSLWPLQILDSLEKFSADIGSRTKVLPAWNAGTRIQRSIEIMAVHCRKHEIKVSASENGQFYKIASFVVPSISDLSYRIQKLLDSEGG